MIAADIRASFVLVHSFLQIKQRLSLFLTLLYFDDDRSYDSSSSSTHSFNSIQFNSTYYTGVVSGSILEALGGVDEHNIRHVLRVPQLLDRLKHKVSQQKTAYYSNHYFAFSHPAVSVTVSTTNTTSKSGGVKSRIMRKFSTEG